MSTQFTPLVGCLEDATERQTALALSVLHLFKSTFNPDPSNVLADYTAQEADYDGYAAETLTAWNAPLLAPGTGYMISSPQVQFQYVDGVTHTTNTIGGCYLVDASGNLRQTIIFTSPIAFQADNQGTDVVLVILFPVNQTTT